MHCHGNIGDEIITTGHFKWEGVSANIEGFEGGIHGKKDILNNFCIAIPTNEGRCTQCHIGYDYKDASYDFGNPQQRRLPGLPRPDRHLFQGTDNGRYGLTGC